MMISHFIKTKKYLDLHDISVSFFNHQQNTLGNNQLTMNRHNVSKTRD